MRLATHKLLPRIWNWRKHISDTFRRAYLLNTCVQRWIVWAFSPSNPRHHKNRNEDAAICGGWGARKMGKPSRAEHVLTLIFTWKSEMEIMDAFKTCQLHLESNMFLKMDKKSMM